MTSTMLGFDGSRSGSTRLKKQLWEHTLAATMREIRATIARRDRVLVIATAVLPIVTGVFIYLVVTTQ